MRYLLWALGVVCVAALITTFLNVISSDSFSASIPDGYRFYVSDNYNGDGKLRTTYYVYDNKIIAEDESFSNDKVNRTVLVYDNISTASLQYNDAETTKFCELGACIEKPKVLVTIKNLISRQTGREYIGL